MMGKLAELYANFLGRPIPGKERVDRAGHLRLGKRALDGFPCLFSTSGRELAVRYDDEVVAFYANLNNYSDFPSRSRVSLMAALRPTGFKFYGVWAEKPEDLGYCALTDYFNRVRYG